jgi:hypothetical protein
LKMSGQYLRKEYGRLETYDRLLREMNRWLLPVEAELTARIKPYPERPMLFIVGAPRSGSTLFTQVLASTGLFAFPSNLIARFYENLAIGARIQKLLEEILPKDTCSFTSNFGRTQGWWEPSEFGFFWERHFPLQDAHELTIDQLASANTKRFTRELAAFEAETGKPVFMKGIILDYHLPFLCELLPKAVFVRITRKAPEIIRSLLQIRMKLYGSYQAWWSIRPKNWRELANLDDPVEQVAAQVKSVNSAVDTALRVIPKDNQITIRYETFCLNTRSELKRLETALRNLGEKINIDGPFPDSFEVSEAKPIGPGLHERITAMCEKYELK